MTKAQLLDRVLWLEHNNKVLYETMNQQYTNIKKCEKKLERLAEIGRAIEWAIENDKPEINIDMYDLEDLVALYKKEVEQCGI